MNINTKVYSVDSEEWKDQCDRLASNFRKGTLIIGIIGLLVCGVFGQYYVLIILIVFCVFQLLAETSKFNELKELGNSQFKLSIHSITHIKPTSNEELEYNDIQNLTHKNWGIEIQSKDKNSKLQIPSATQNFEQIKDYLDSKMNSRS